MDEQVNIPALLLVFNGVTRLMILDAIWLCALLVSRLALGKSGAIKTENRDEGLLRQGRANRFDRQEKPLELS